MAVVGTAMTVGQEPEPGAGQNLVGVDFRSYIADTGNVPGRSTTLVIESIVGWTCLLENTRQIRRARVLANLGDVWMNQGWSNRESLLSVAILYNELRLRCFPGVCCGCKSVVMIVNNRKNSDVTNSEQDGKKIKNTQEGPSLLIFIFQFVDMNNEARSWMDRCT